jgi:hypothetical protein
VRPAGSSGADAPGLYLPGTSITAEWSLEALTKTGTPRACLPRLLLSISATKSGDTCLTMQCGADAGNIHQLEAKVTPVMFSPACKHVTLHPPSPKEIRRQGPIL